MSVPKCRVGRRILCDMCSNVFQGAGQSRVMRKVVFHFCPKCWANRRACEVHMDRVSSPGPVAAEAAA